MGVTVMWPCRLSKASLLGSVLAVASAGVWGTMVTPAKTDPKSEALLSLQGHITVTPMQFGYELPKVSGELFGLRLKKAFETGHSKHD
jgi:hypothetical protein